MNKNEIIFEIYDHVCFGASPYLHLSQEVSIDRVEKLARAASRSPRPAKLSGCACRQGPSSKTASACLHVVDDMCKQCILLGTVQLSLWGRRHVPAFGRLGWVTNVRSALSVSASEKFGGFWREAAKSASRQSGPLNGPINKIKETAQIPELHRKYIPAYPSNGDYLRAREA